MDWLAAFGLCAVTAMLLFYALEDRNPAYILAFAAACVLASIYGFAQGRGRSAGRRGVGADRGAALAQTDRAFRHERTRP